MALATIVGICLSLVFKLISVLRPEEVVLDADESDTSGKSWIKPAQDCRPVLASNPFPSVVNSSRFFVSPC
ncbi:hypothetical protein ACLK1Y_13995 [Escherichia coli]